MRRLPSLDGLRAVSVLLVIIGHASNTTGAPRWFSFAEPYANFGVRVFFVISGFLITHLLLKEHAKADRIDLPDFYVRRFFRIFPAAYVYVGFIAVAFWPTLTATDLVTAFGYLSNYHPGRPWEFGHLWSLAVEEQFYLLWPLALVAFFPARYKVAFLAIVGAPVIRAALFLVHRPEGAYLWFPSLADSLATGCLLAISRGRLAPFASKFMGRWFLVVPAVTVLLVQFGETKLLGRGTNAFYWVAVVPLIHLGIALTIEHALRRPYWILNARPVAWIGGLSYSLYLWQQLFLAPRSPFAWRAWPTNVGLTLALACASYYLVEQPALRLRERLTRGSVAVARDAVEGA
jgi:peptidoglycan/LPS O-acetylase OafA/YrhL